VVPWLEDWRGSSENYFGPFSDSARVKLEPERERTERERMKMLQELQQRHFRAVESECVVKTGESPMPWSNSPRKRMSV
jgi:hypothetical protein